MIERTTNPTGICKLCVLHVHVLDAYIALILALRYTWVSMTTASTPCRRSLTRRHSLSGRGHCFSRGRSTSYLSNTSRQIREIKIRSISRCQRIPQEDHLSCSVRFSLNNHMYECTMEVRFYRAFSVGHCTLDWNKILTSAQKAKTQCSTQQCLIWWFPLHCHCH